MLFPEVNQDFEPPAPGTYTATLIEFLDLGTQEGEYGPKRNVRLSWEIIGNSMRNGKPFVVSRLFNFSMAEKSSLRPFVEAMMGRKFSSKDKELDTQNLLGKACLIEISHKETGEKTYANVTGCLPLPAGTPIPTAPFISLLIPKSSMKRRSTVWQSGSRSRLESRLDELGVHQGTEGDEAVRNYQRRGPLLI